MRPSSHNVKAGDVTRIPDLTIVKRLIQGAWARVCVQGGQLRHTSRSFPGAWSTSGFLISNETDVLIHAESIETDGDEVFGLVFCRATNGCSLHLNEARPAFSVISNWPPNISIPPALWSAGPMGGSIGLGAPIEIVREGKSDWAIPIIWCLIKVHGGELTFFADVDIPLNVGIASGESGGQVRRALRAMSTLSL